MSSTKSRLRAKLNAKNSCANSCANGNLTGDFMTIKAIQKAFKETRIDADDQTNSKNEVMNTILIASKRLCQIAKIFTDNSTKAFMNAFDEQIGERFADESCEYRTLGMADFRRLYKCTCNPNNTKDLVLRARKKEFKYCIGDHLKSEDDIITDHFWWYDKSTYSNVENDDFCDPGFSPEIRHDIAYLLMHPNLTMFDVTRHISMNQLNYGEPMNIGKPAIGQFHEMPVRTRASALELFRHGEDEWDKYHTDECLKTRDLKAVKNFLINATYFTPFDIDGNPPDVIPLPDNMAHRPTEKTEFTIIDVNLTPEYWVSRVVKLILVYLFKQTIGAAWAFDDLYQEFPHLRNREDGLYIRNAKSLIDGINIKEDEQYKVKQIMFYIKKVIVFFLTAWRRELIGTANCIEDVHVIAAITNVITLYPEIEI